jgi:acetyl-CoA carboxylase biotin carboxyl carrier protein
LLPLQQLIICIRLRVNIEFQEDAEMAIVDVKTEITGTVWKIEASVGASLGEDDPIVILESMKMEIPVTAPESGTLVEILVAEGETVTEGSVVARIKA